MICSNQWQDLTPTPDEVLILHFAVTLVSVHGPVRHFLAVADLLPGSLLDNAPVSLRYTRALCNHLIDILTG